MKKLLLILLAILILCGCGQNKESFDGKDRPSTRGQLQVIDGQLCGKDKNPIVLRGLSGNGVSLSDRYINQDTFDELSHKFGANVFRMALYTWGVGVVGYCTGGNKEKLKKLMIDSVELAKKSDMYVILDWHILEDKDPNVYPDAKKYDKVSHDEVLRLNLKVMDATAAALCRDNHTKILVFSMRDPENIVRIAKGEELGTIVE